MANGYTKLVGMSSSGRLRTFSLWQGADHLLLVERDGYSENYKRFYFSDIRAITVGRTKTYQTWFIVLLVLIAFFTWFAVLGSGFSRYFSLFWVVFFMIPFALNLIAGPTCATKLMTAVQIEDLPLRRVRKTKRVLEKIREVIVASQGELPVEIARGGYAARIASETRKVPPPLPLSLPLPPPPLSKVPPPPRASEAPPPLPPPM